MTQATCSIASGEHQPCTRCAAASAGIDAERRSGYLAMNASISARSSSGTGVVAGSGTAAGSFDRSAARSQPGTREPWPKRGTALTSVAPSGEASRKSVTSGPLSVDAPQHRVEHRQRGDEVGDVGVLDHRREGLEVHEAGIAHVHARRLARAVRAHEAAVLATRALDREVDLARRHAEALGDEL